MNEELNYYLGELEKDNGASEKAINALVTELEFSLPNDYLEFMALHNGGEGPVGEHSWLILYPLEKLIQVNKSYTLLMEQIPDYFLFGKDAADGGYAFHKKSHAVYTFGLLSNFKTGPIEFCGNNFTEFTQYLYNAPD